MGRMTRFSWGVLALAGIMALLVGLGCGDDSTSPNTFDPPGALSVVNGDLEIDLTWTASPDEGGGGFKQYNVYRGTSSLANVASGSLPAPIATLAAGVHTYQNTLSANGTLYYFHVRSEDTNGNLSGASPEVKGAGRDEGTGLIIEEFVSSGDSGFDFSTGLTVSLGAGNPDRFDKTDLYLGTTATDDAQTAGLALKSPELLQRLGNSEWISRNADIKEIGTDFDVTTTEGVGAGWADQQTVTEGKVYAIKTPSGNYAKVKVLDIEGAAGSRAITFKYAYQPTVNLVLF